MDFFWESEKDNYWQKKLSFNYSRKSASTEDQFFQFLPGNKFYYTNKMHCKTGQIHFGFIGYC